MVICETATQGCAPFGEEFGADGLTYQEYLNLGGDFWIRSRRSSNYFHEINRAARLVGRGEHYAGKLVCAYVHLCMLVDWKQEPWIRAENMEPEPRMSVAEWKEALLHLAKGGVIARHLRKDGQYYYRVPGLPHNPDASESTT